MDDQTIYLPGTGYYIHLVQLNINRPNYRPSLLVCSEPIEPKVLIYNNLKFNRFLTFFKVSSYSLHELGKNPKGHVIFLINIQNDHGNVGHSLDVTKILVVDCISGKKVGQTLDFRFFKTGWLSSYDVFTD